MSVVVSEFVDVLKRYFERGLETETLRIPGQAPWPGAKTTLRVACKALAVVNFPVISVFQSVGGTPKLTLTLNFEDQ